MADQSLSAHHLAHLREGSGLSDDIIIERGYRSITMRTSLREYGFSAEQCKSAPGLLIPQYATDGSNGRYTFRPDQPRVVHDKRKNKTRVIKYENPKDAGIRLDCPPRCRSNLGNPQIALWITEGTKKSDAGATHGLCIIALNGVWGFKGQNEFGGVTILADWDHVALKGRNVNIVFDNDVMLKPEVRGAMNRLTDFLQRKGALVNCVYLPKEGDNAKIGLDDYLLKHSVQELEGLIDGPRPQIKAAPAHVELLEETPAMIARPLMLLDGKAVAAIWPFVKVTVPETTNKAGEIVRHNPPIETTEQRLMIVRSDGLVFGDGKREISDTGAIIHLPEIPTQQKLWSTVGIKRWLQGARPSPADVFNRITDVVDRFIDFDRSLTDQRGMSEMLSCYILATWFLDAFNVIGYVWPNGERGSGKTQLLLILSELGFLGQMVQASGSFAALRDLADYGALLCFDDAENLADPKMTDPDKRTLLLAGNRRGSTVPVKEQRSDGTWRTRHVNTYCARAYSAIRQPDPVLASRTITIPLIRSGNKEKANSDPLEYDLWPHDRRTLIDDLWGLALSSLPNLAGYERRVNTESDLAGRNLEPWRAVLAIALWLDDNGVPGLSDRMRKLSVGYQSERAEFESGDLTRLVVRAICAICAICAITFETSAQDICTSDITQKTKQIAEDEESGIDTETINSKRVGRILRNLRLDRVGRDGGRKGRKWRVKVADLARWRIAYSLIEEEVQEGVKPNGANGANGEMAQSETQALTDTVRPLNEVIADLSDSEHRRRVTL